MRKRRRSIPAINSVSRTDAGSMFQGQLGTETETQQAVDGNYRVPEDNQPYFRAWKPLLDCPKGVDGTPGRSVALPRRGPPAT